MELLKIDIFHKTFFLTLLLSIFFFKQGLSQFHYNSFYCQETAGNYTDGSTYKKNLDLLLPVLTSKASLALFNNFTLGEGIDKAYGLYMCRGDLDDQQCHDCVKAASKAITESCPTEIEAIVWYEECLVRYTNRSIFNLEESSPLSYSWSTPNVSNPAHFGKIIAETMDGLIMEAAYNASRKGYATAEANITIFETLYTMAQCTPDILGSRCERCLRVALSTMGGCCGTSRVFMTMYFPSCWLRYASSPFVKDINAPPLAPEPSSFPLNPQPQGKSIATTLTPMGMPSGVWLLMSISILIMTSMAL